MLPVTLDVPPEACANLAATITDLVQPDLVLIAAQLPAHKYTGPGDPAANACFHELTTAAAEADAAVNRRLQPLPVGNLVSGLAAGLLSCAQVCQLPINSALCCEISCQCLKVL